MCSVENKQMMMTHPGGACTFQPWRCGPPHSWCAHKPFPLLQHSCPGSASVLGIHPGHRRYAHGWHMPMPDSVLRCNPLL